MQSVGIEERAPGVTRRRHRTVEEKRRIVQESLKPGASVAVVARRFDVNANQIFTWRLRWLGNFGHGDKWIGLLYIPKWKEQIRCEDPDETIPPRLREKHSCARCASIVQALAPSRPIERGLPRSRAARSCDRR
jgi:transposase-like protein